MTRNQENKRSMYLAVQQVLLNFNGVWSGLVAFVTASTKFSNQIGLINALRLIQEKDYKGITANKAEAKEAVIAQAISVSGAVQAYANNEGDNDLLETVNYSNSYMQKSPDSEVRDITQLIHDKANEVVASLGDYGVDAGVLENLQTAIDTYVLLIPAPRAAIISRKTSTAQIKATIKAADDVLKKELDMLMLQYKLSNDDFFQTYTSARIIVDHGAPSSGGNNTAPNTATMEGTILNVITSNGFPNALVEVKQGATVVYSTNTDANGNYKITGIEAGTYNVVFSASGYTPQTLTNVVFEAEDERTENVSLMPLVAVISGVARDINTNNPIANARVIVYEGGDPEKYLEAFTDAGGNYTLEVPVTASTNVTLEATAPNYLQEQQSLTLNPNTDYPNRDFNLTPVV